MKVVWSYSFLVGFETNQNKLSTSGKHRHALYKASYLMATANVFTPIRIGVYGY